VPRITRLTPGCAPSILSVSARLRRKTAGVAAGAIALASVAAYARADAPGADAGQDASVAEICQTVVRIEPGGAQYEACVLSLADSLRSLGRDRAMRQARIDCLDKGLRPDSRGLAERTLQLTGAGPTSSRSYFYVSQSEVYRREQLSCIRLGFDPADGAFADCVANLDGGLFAADNPSQ
jgi:hypothetical protein